MKFILPYKLFEKTSLIGIGVPYPAMQTIQKNFEISDDAKWKKIKYKKDITLALHKPKNTLLISIFSNKLLIIFSYNKEFFIETYILTEKDDFGDEGWSKIDRIKTNITDIMKKVSKGCISYELISGSWLHDYSSVRKIKREDTNFETITNNFKKDFAENFTRIIKQIYGKKAETISEVIIDHLKNLGNNLSSDEIREILLMNTQRAKEIDKLKKKKKEKDPYKLYNDIVNADSLTIFNDYILRFEDEYSEKYDEYLNIPMMIEKWGRDKIFTAFMVYLYCKKLINL